MNSKNKQHPEGGKWYERKAGGLGYHPMYPVIWPPPALSMLYCLYAGYQIRDMHGVSDVGICSPGRWRATPVASLRQAGRPVIEAQTRNTLLEAIDQGYQVDADRRRKFMDRTDGKHQRALPKTTA